MSEPHIREVMSSGAWFHPVHPDLIVDSGRAQEVMFQFNNSPDLDDHSRMALLRSAFAHIGEDSFVMPGLRFDYGYNVSIGNSCFFNFNCVFLDGAPIRFGNRVMAGACSSRPCTRCSPRSATSTPPTARGRSNGNGSFR